MVSYVFDAYGTLLDVHSAVARHREPMGPDALAFSDLWRQKQLEYSWTLALAGRYLNFWQLTERALDYALARYPSVPKSLRAALLDAYLELDAYPDALPALAALKARGITTAVLSNGSPAMLARGIAASALDRYLDHVLSVDALRTYKPSPAVYELATARLGVPPGEIVFVSSNRWDIAGATGFGFRTVWVNRVAWPEEYGELPSRAVIPTLGGLDAAGI